MSLQWWPLLSCYFISVGNSLSLFLLLCLSLLSVSKKKKKKKNFFLFFPAAVIYGRWIKEISKKYQDALAESSDTANEAISNIRTVRSFAKEEFEISRYEGEKIFFILSKIFFYPQKIFFPGKIMKTYDLAKRKAIAFALFSVKKKFYFFHNEKKFFLGIYYFFGKHNCWGCFMVWRDSCN
jgi:ABC-type multidrug transport system fused ATPase/permease subunit